MKTSQKAIELLIKLEGIERTIYKCPAGYPTIGVGHKLTQREIIGEKFKHGITRDEVLELLEADLAPREAALLRMVHTPLTQNQFDALMLLIFNIGEAAFAKSSVLIYLNAGNLDMVPPSILMWNKITVGGKKVISKGLAHRREQEVALWNGN